MVADDPTDDSTDNEQDSGLWFPCWFCGTKADAPAAFSFEFDTPYHLHCAAAEGVADERDPVLAHEEARFEESEPTVKDQVTTTFEPDGNSKVVCSIQDDEAVVEVVEDIINADSAPDE